jgi:nucleotide-binding universal stress UspA family protein
MKVQNILVAVDFSPASRYAVDLGVALARTFRATLTLLHVLDDTSAIGYAFPTQRDVIEKRRLDQALRLLSQLLGPEDQDDLNLQIRIRKGNVENEIRSSINDEQASMVIMGTHHHGVAQRLAAGSVTRDLLRKLPVPAITISNDGHAMKFSRIMFATDLSEASHAAFISTLEIARQLSSELIVFHSIEPVPVRYGVLLPGIDTKEGRQRLIEEVQARLKALEEEGSRAGIAVRTKLTEGSAAEALLAAAEGSAAQMIIMTVPHRGILERAILGSTAERVIQDAKVPVLSLPEGVKMHSDVSMKLQKAVEGNALGQIPLPTGEGGPRQRAR